MIAVHPYIRYAQALLMAENNLSSCDEITQEIIVAGIEKGLDAFRMCPVETYEGKTKVKFEFAKLEKPATDKGVFLAPNVISTDKSAINIWNAANELIRLLKSDPSKGAMFSNVKKSIAPTSGEFSSFSNKISRGHPKSTNIEQGLSAITTLTHYKPCLQFRIDKKDGPKMFNVCIIPDLPIENLKLFIRFFKRMLYTNTANDLKLGAVSQTKEKSVTTYSPKRPLIYKGNFPNPPQSSSLGSIALLGAIGELAKESEFSEQAQRVLESLENTTMYIIKYDGASVFTYNHYIIKLAKEAKLKTVVDSLHHSKLYDWNDKRTNKGGNYQKFDLFTSRFLQLFNRPSFIDFLAFRAEYPNPVEILFNSYFTNMEKIDLKIVSSARQLGKWLNTVAYWVAKSEVKEDNLNYWGKLREKKSKVLIELESSIFAAKTGDMLIAQVITRAGRLSGLDAPEAATLYMEQTMSGELAIDVAKNLLIAFSRLTNKKQQDEQPTSIVAQIDDIDGTDIDLSNE